MVGYSRFETLTECECWMICQLLLRFDLRFLLRHDSRLSLLKINKFWPDNSIRLNFWNSKLKPKNWNVNWQRFTHHMIRLSKNILQAISGLNCVKQDSKPKCCCFFLYRYWKPIKNLPFWNEVYTGFQWLKARLISYMADNGFELLKIDWHADM